MIVAEYFEKLKQVQKYMIMKLNNDAMMNVVSLSLPPMKDCIGLPR